MKALLAYGVASALLLAVLAGLVSGLVEAADPPAVWTAAAIAWPVQLAAFWALLAGRSGPGFMVSWAGGMLLRFAAVGAVAVWLTQTETLDPATGLLSLVGFVFVLVLLEPMFLRLAD